MVNDGVKTRKMHIKLRWNFSLFENELEARIAMKPTLIASYDLR